MQLNDKLARVNVKLEVKKSIQIIFWFYEQNAQGKLSYSSLTNILEKINKKTFITKFNE